MVVIEIQVHALDGKPLGSNLRRFQQGEREMPSKHARDLAWSPRKGLLGESIPVCFLCPDLTPTDPMCLAFAIFVLFAFFLCLRLGALGEGLSLSIVLLIGHYILTVCKMSKGGLTCRVGWPGGTSSGDVAQAEAGKSGMCVSSEHDIAEAHWGHQPRS